MADNEPLRIVLFCHPEFWAGPSMLSFAQMLRSSYEARGHQVQILSPRGRFYTMLSRSRLRKWAVYADEYLLFPLEVRKVLREIPADALFVFCDQALGPWVPLVADRPHVVHVHDLLALRSALGDIAENRPSVSGRIYQNYIRRGFRQARHFISVSNRTREDLHRFGDVMAETSDVVYNGLAFPFHRLSAVEAMDILRTARLPVEPRGMLLHVGGGQWYKNPLGVVALYASYASRVPEPLPLWVIGGAPSAELAAAARSVPEPGRVLFFQNIDNRTLQAAYSHARLFLFPSLAEGFGWPLIEAQACGCRVITTDEAPMNEIAGDAAHYIPRLQPGQDIQAWAAECAGLIEQLLEQNAAERNLLAARASLWAQSFNPDRAIDRYLSIYRHVLDSYFARAASVSTVS